MPDIKNEEWWNSLTQEEREKAFYAVTQRIFQSVICGQTNYKDVVSDVFGCEDTSIGMESGYYAIHNTLVEAMQTKYKQEYK